jgi:hypothetical protein
LEVYSEVLRGGSGIFEGLERVYGKVLKGVKVY